MCSELFFFFFKPFADTLLSLNINHNTQVFRKKKEMIELQKYNGQFISTVQ